MINTRFKKGQIPWNKGRVLTEKEKEEISKATKLGMKNMSNEDKKKMLANLHQNHRCWNRGKKLSKEQYPNYGVRKNNPMKNPLIVEKMVKSKIGHWNGCGYKKGHKESEETREKRLEKVYRGLHLKPNKPEKIMKGIIKDNNLPFIYTGDGKIIIGGFNPDFLSKNPKHIIEVYGDYWHNLPSYKERDKRRILAYTKLGYRTLVIWEHELEFPSNVLDKVRKFLNE